MKNYSKVFKVFRKNYKLVPLEVYGKDPYKTLVATLLSSRTRDETTLRVTKRLFKVAPNIEELSKLGKTELAGLIYPVGFYKTKAKHLKELSHRILGEFKGKIPKNREDLTSLPGVGRKTANLVLNRAFGIPAIAVDTHVHRISNLLGWVKTNSPEETELALIKILPKKYWPETNKLLVYVGQQYRSVNSLKGFLKKSGLTSK